MNVLYFLWIVVLGIDVQGSVLIREDLADNSRCLDGSQASFYHSKYTKNEKDFLIYLQPGGYCHNLDTCQFRCNIAPFMCQSPTKPSILKREGILSDREEINPFFASFYKIVIPYCTGDMFTGTRSASNQTDGFAFLGRALLTGVIHAMDDMKGMMSARRVVLAGSSAGGAGVVFNCDLVASLLPAANVKCVVDGAFFYPIQKKFREDPDCESIDTVLHQGAGLWGVPELRKFPLHGPWWEAVKQPLFISTAGVDQFGFQSYCGDKHNRTDMRIWSRGTEKMAKSLHDEKVDVGLFMPSCFDHMMLIDDDMFNKVKVGWQEMTLSDALGLWLFGDVEIKVWDACAVSDDVMCNPHCANKVMTYADMAL